MENPPITPARAVIASNCLIVSSNSQLSEQLGEQLTSEYGCRVMVKATAEEAKAEVALRNEPLTVFQDTLTVGDNLERQLSESYPGSRTQLRVIPIGSRPTNSRTTSLLPLDRHKFRRALEASQFLHGPATEPRVVKFGEFAYSTYCPHLFATLENLRRVASHDVTILLVGETGTGKTTLARLVHNLSSRCREPLLTVACGALPGELIESELFGHVRGSFTGAEVSKIGKFEAAGTGSLLLDEIDVLGLHQQARLLRVIESGEFEPVGSNETRVSQARLIAATNVDLNDLMDRSEFRSDLYYRLNVLEFSIPPLRKRPLDIIPLTLSFVDEFCASHDVVVRRVDPEFLECVRTYNWPGNVRELKNHIRRAVLFCENKELTPRDLNPIIQSSRTVAQAAQGPDTLSEMVACSEQELIEQALRDHNFKRSSTAEALGISRVGLYKKMRKYGMLDLKASRRGLEQGMTKLPTQHR